MENTGVSDYGRIWTFVPNTDLLHAENLESSSGVAPGNAAFLVPSARNEVAAPFCGAQPGHRDPQSRAGQTCTQEGGEKYAYHGLLTEGTRQEEGRVDCAKDGPSESERDGEEQRPRGDGGEAGRSCEA